MPISNKLDNLNQVILYTIYCTSTWLEKKQTVNSYKLLIALIDMLVKDEVSLSFSLSTHA